MEITIAMDLNESYQDLLVKNFTDIELILIDPHNSIIIHAHKIILACSSKYFKKLFTIGKIGDGINKSVIEIHTRNSKIAHDVILTFYGKNINSANYPEWKHILEMIICRDYFSLPIDASLLYNLTVPMEGFDLLIETATLFDYINDYELIRTIKNNFPYDYDLSKLSNDFIKEIIGISDQKIISGSTDKTIKIWDMDTGQLLKTLHANSKVYSVSISSDNQKIASGCNNRSIKIWNALTGQLLNTIIGAHTEYITSVSFSGDCLKIVSGCGIDPAELTSSIKIWDVETGKLLNTLNGAHTKSISRVSFSPDNLKIVSGSFDKSIKIWDVNTGQLLNTLNEHINWVYDVAFSSDNLKIVSCSDNETVKLWDIVSGQLLNTFIPNSHKKSALNVSFSSDNLKIVSGSSDKSIKIWDTVTGQLLNTLNGAHTQGVLCVLFSADNLKIVSSSQDESIKIWDATTGQLLNTLVGHTDWVGSITLSKSSYLTLNKKLIDYLNNNKYSI